MNQQAKTKRQFPYVGLILWVTLALVVVILGYTIMDTIGVFGMAKAGETSGEGKFKLTENQVDVYRYQVAQNQLYMEYMYIRNGMMTDPTGGLIQTMSADQYINSMLPLAAGTDTYDSLAYDYAEQYLTYCEGAKAAKLYDTYKAEVAADIDSYIESLKEVAKANDISFNSYLKNYMGNGVSEKDVRSAMEYSYIGAKYAEKLTDDFTASVTDEDEKKYRDEHKEDFYTTDYFAYKLVNVDMKADIEKCTTVEEVKAVIVDYYLNQKFEDNYKTNFTEKKVTDTPGKEKTREDIRTTLLALAKVNVSENKEIFKDSKENSDYQKAAYAIVKAINSSVSTQTAKITESTANYVNINPLKADGTPDTEAAKKLSEVQKWLFADGRKAGDYKLMETKTTSTDKDGKEVTNTTYTWYLVGEKVMALDEEHTKNAHYVMLTDDAADAKDKMTAEQKAKKFHEELSKVTGDKDAKAKKFQELVETYAPGYSSELVEYISYEDMKATYEDLATWLYDKRDEGDISDVIVLKNDSKDENKVTGCIVALYMGENEETWKVSATMALAEEKLKAWYDKAVEDYGVVIDYEFETETEAETK